MDGQGLLFVIDALGKQLAAVQAENEQLKTQLQKLGETLAQQA